MAFQKEGLEEASFGQNIGRTSAQLQGQHCNEHLEGRGSAIPL